MEIEIKFQVPASERAALADWLREQSATTERLEARYFDTPDRMLARAGVALRLRKEGKHWVQTLKTAPHGGALARTEHNVALGSGSCVPTLDLQRHQDTDGWPLLKRTLRKSDRKLAALYTTDMRRLAGRICAHDATIEYALDTGSISAQAADAEPLAVEVSELEIELVSGTPQALFAAAAQLLQERSLWLDVRSKAMRGDSLARGHRIVPPAGAAAPKLPDHPTLSAVMLATLAECVRHLCQPLSQIASDEGYHDEHLRQARTALRRLRSALALFSSHLPPAWQPWHGMARELAREIGSRPAIDVLRSEFWPRLAQAGAPLVELPTGEPATVPAAAVRNRLVQQWLLQLLAVQLMQPPPDDHERWEPLLPTLEHWHAQCRMAARRFEQLGDAQRDRLRRRLKRLRDASEFISGLYPTGRNEAYAKRLAGALERFAEYRNLCAALERYRLAAQTRPGALFAVGWLSAQRELSEQACAKALAKFARSEPPWA